MALSIDTLSAASYGLGLLGFVGFSLQLALRSRRSWRARLLLVASATTALWELSGLVFSVRPSAWLWFGYQLADAARFGAWIALASALLPDGKPREAATRPLSGARLRLALGATSVLACGAVVSFLGTYSGEAVARAVAGWVFGLWVAASVFGLAVCEHLFRNTPDARRWAIKPLCLALGASFGFDLLMFSDGLLLRTLDYDLWSIRGLVHALTIPLVMIATVRNRDWTIDVAVSRTVVFRSTALLLSGLYLLAVAGAGYYVRYFGGDWGKAVQTAFLFAALVLLALLFSSGTIRSKLRVFISKHFFSYRYDYREEWLRFTNLLATSSAELSVAERSIKALADLVESPAGALWLRAEDGAFRPGGRWNLPEMAQELPADSSLIGFLARTGWVIDIVDHQARRDGYQDLTLPVWLGELPGAWLVIPLPSADTLIGFVLLTRPRTSVDVNWEVRDLLKTAARQAAAFLGHVRATEALVETKQFDAFNRMSAFVVHDLKNLVAQLSLMLRNAERHASNPEFQKDMLSTIQHVVDRMNRLLLQLRSGTTPVENAKSVDLALIVERVRAAHPARGHSISLDIQPGLRALGHEERLERVIGHLVQNAVDATPTGGKVSVRAYEETGRTVIEVADTGHGMTTEFVREHLFKPFHSTKSAGMGIGAYESHQYVAELGGHISVDTAPGAGTRIRVVLPNRATEAPEARQRQEAA
jgi:putative PEP-CTERM system histidine kinase